MPSLRELRQRAESEPSRSPHARGERSDRPPSAGAVLLAGVGTLIILLGVGLLIGNVTGVFPTFPFAGFIVMTIGGVIAGAAGAGGDDD